MKPAALGLAALLALAAPLGARGAARAQPVPPTSAAPVSSAEAAWFEAARQGEVAALRRAVARLPKAKLAAALDRADASGYTALILAVYHDHGEAARWLLARGASTCAVDRRGFTALMGAVFRGHAALVDLLSTRPCGADHVTPAGQTPLMLAALFGRTEIARALLRAGADPSHRDELGNDARSLADGQGHAEIVRLIDERMRSR